MEAVDARYLARKEPYKMYYPGPNGETINKEKFLRVVSPIVEQCPKRMDKRQLLREIQACIKKRRTYHLRMLVPLS